jgi:hypothetical protein
MTTILLIALITTASPRETRVEVIERYSSLEECGLRASYLHAMRNRSPYVRELFVCRKRGA